jgi:drug/metabolite transporter (DMT)-like permease
MSPRLALLMLHAAVALFGFAALFGKWLALAPTQIVLGRTVVGAACLALVSLLRDRRLAPPDRGLAMNGVLLAVHWVSFFAAVQVSSVAIGLLGYASFPAFVLALERGRSDPARGRMEWITVALVTTGLLLMVPRFSWSERAVHGLAWGVVSGFTFAWLAVRNRHRLRDRTATDLAMWQNAFAALAVLVLVLVDTTEFVLPTTRDLALLLVLGAFCTALSHTLFIASMQRLSTHTASVTAGLEPVYGIVLAALLLNEIPDARTLLGGALILAATVIASRAST